MKKNTFEKALLCFDKKKRIIIESRVLSWRRFSTLGTRVGENLIKEENLPVEEMEQILNLFLSDFLSEKVEHIAFFEKKFGKLCRTLSFKGSTINLASIGLMGRAVVLDRFKAMLADMYPLYTDSDIENFIFNIVNKCLSKFQRRMPISKYPIWATWSDSENQNHPFYYTVEKTVCGTGIPSKSFQVCANLGLYKSQSTEAHITFVYRKDSIKTIKVPTIADGATYEYFKYAIGNEGRTQSWSIDDIKSRYPCLNEDWIRKHVRPRPECIHSIILAGHVESVEILK